MSLTMTHRVISHIKGKLGKPACLFLSLLLLLGSGSVQAGFADFLQVDSIPNADFGIWTQAGNVSTRLKSCIASASDNSSNPRGYFAWKMPYQVKIENVSGESNFYLYLNGNTSNSGNRRLGIYFSHRDIMDGGSFEALSHDSYDTHAHVGNFKNCVSGDNSELRIDISGAELGDKVSGYYTGTFRLTAIGGIWGYQTDSVEFTVSIQIQAGAEVRISNLDDIHFGTHAGMGNLYAEENFCIYSSSLSGSYTLSVSSVNQDGGGNFHLDGGSLGQIAYDLRFTDSASGPGNEAVGLGSLSGFGDSQNQDCNGGNNATLSVAISEQDLQGAKSGIYDDSLIILVEPQ